MIVDKGATPSPSRGTGHRTRVIPSLPQVLSDEGLPAVTAPDQLPPGEQRAIQQMGVIAFVHQLQQPRRVSRKPKE